MTAFIGREAELTAIRDFVAVTAPEATLGLVWGRRRVGKSKMLEALVAETGGVYFQALRGSSDEALRELGEVLGAASGAPGPLSLTSWEDAVTKVMSLGQQRDRVVVLDEFPYLLEHTPSLDSILQRHFGPGHPSRAGTRTRLILCGSSISMMSNLLMGTAPLRGRAGMALRVSPFDFRTARVLHDVTDFRTAILLFAVIGGVAAYAREMVSFDLPKDPETFSRWITRRVLAPSAPLFGEIDLLLGEDPAMGSRRKVNLYHSTLSAVARGSHTWTDVCKYVGLSGNKLQPIMDTLGASEFVARIGDPVRGNRPTYDTADALLRFHYAVIRRHQARLSRHGVDTDALWRELTPTFRAQVLGPSFEAMARYWATHFASTTTLGGAPAHVGPTVISGDEGDLQELDVVVATDEGGQPPDQRLILAIGEAKVGETLTLHMLRRLERARAHFAKRAQDAKLLLFGSTVDPDLRQHASDRSDVEIIDLERLYEGS